MEQDNYLPTNPPICNYFYPSIYENSSQNYQNPEYYQDYQRLYYEPSFQAIFGISNSIYHKTTMREDLGIYFNDFLQDERAESRTPEVQVERFTPDMKKTKYAQIESIQWNNLKDIEMDNIQNEVEEYIVASPNASDDTGMLHLIYSVNI